MDLERAIERLTLKEKIIVQKKLEKLLVLRTGCDYKEAYREVLRKNINNIFNELNAPGMLLKIKNWADKFGYDFETVKQKIMSDNMFAMNFIKDPAKQNIYENKALEFLSCFFDNSLKKLPSSGDGSLYLLENGAITINKTFAKSTKSIDFFGTKDEDVYFMTHKYTKEAGGAQDNQYADACQFLSYARNNTSSSNYFVAILDGDYYKNKIITTRNSLGTDNVLIMSIDDFANYIYRKYG